MRVRARVRGAEGAIDSGFGRFGGQAGAAGFNKLRWITVQTTERRCPL